jgi:hypothetical protein
MGVVCTRRACAGARDDEALSPESVTIVNTSLYIAQCRAGRGAQSERMFEPTAFGVSVVVDASFVVRIAQRRLGFEAAKDHPRRGHSRGEGVCGGHDVDGVA